MPTDKNIKNLGGKSVSASFYYYGCQASEWEHMDYYEAIEDRHNKAKKLLEILYKEDIEIGYTEPLPEEKALRLRKVQTAVKDTKQLLDERTLQI